MTASVAKADNRSPGVRPFPVPRELMSQTIFRPSQGIYGHVILQWATVESPTWNLVPIGVFLASMSQSVIEHQNEDISQRHADLTT